MPNAYISGTGSYVPPRVVSNDDLVNEYGIDTSNEWIVKRTGIEQRHYADQGVITSDLGAEAAKKALENAGLQANDLDMILFATLSPDMTFPGSGVFMQEKLGLCEGDAPKFVPCMDIRNQCSGFLYGLQTATAMVESGQCKHVLLVGAEIHSGALDLSTRGRSVASLFGDGAGAVIVSATDEDRGVRFSVLGADGRYGDKLCQKLFDMSRRPFIPVDEETGEGRVTPEMMYPYMEGRLVFKNAVMRMCESLVAACWNQKIDVKDIDLFAFHQANLRINQYVAQTMNIPEEKLLSNIQRYGNTTAATIPLLLDEANRDGTLEPGMKVAAVAFGSGFTWGAAIIDW